MCGINGFNFHDEALVIKMNDRLSHRGPDTAGVYCADGISLGHRRLAIIDLSPAAAQPMHSSDGAAVIVFNGEIYNFQELKAELDAYHFKSNSDTEVILAAYQKWGRECVKKFNGIFAFGIWDKNKQELFCARDQFGVKPFYYYYDSEHFIFSSEIKGILAHRVTKNLDLDALNIYFRLLYVPAPLTPWQNIYKLPPAHYAVLKDTTLVITKYWKAGKFDYLEDRNEIKAAVAFTFKTAVERQLISDRPLGLYLSGGIDSTALLGVMSEKLQRPVQTFSVGFDVLPEQRGKFNADFNLAEKTSAYFQSDHHRITLSARDVIRDFEHVVWPADDLVSNHTQTAMFALSKLAKPSVAVVLAGDGGDELFAGYSRYYLNYLLDKIQLVPRWLRQNSGVVFLFSAVGKQDLYHKLNLPKGSARWLAFMAQKEVVVGGFLRPEFNNANVQAAFMQKNFFHTAAMSSTKQLQYADLQTWLVDDALNRGDRMSMAHGVEARVPFLDTDLVSLALAIPPRYMVGNRAGGKVLLKEALRDFIPDFVYNEPKRGFFSPVAKWLRGDLQEWAREILSSDYNKNTQDFFDFKAIETIFNKHVASEQYALNTLWSLLNFQVWYKLFNGN